MRVSIVVAACGLLMLFALPSAAGAAACPAPRAAGDDPVVTPGDEGLCDDGGYEAEFPDVPLESDAVEGGGTVDAPTDPVAPTDVAGGGDVTEYRGSLPTTGADGMVLALAALGLVLVTMGGTMVLAAREVQA